jgi:hypothetical protein
MSEFDDRMKKYGLKLSDAEKPKLEQLVKDLDRAAEAIRSVERSYLEEPSNVFRLTPAKK